MTISSYRDFYPVGLDDVRSQMNIPSCKRKGPRGGVVNPFPVKLFSMLETTREEGLHHIVSWQVHGRCFRIHKSDRFVTDVLPRFFKQSKLASFQRQLNLWGFQKVMNGPDRGGYFHELFLRGRPDLAPLMLRVKGCAMEGVVVKDDHGTEDPNFYSYPYCEMDKVPTLTSSSEMRANLIEPSTPPDSPRPDPIIQSSSSSPPRRGKRQKPTNTMVTPPYKKKKAIGVLAAPRDMDESRWGQERRKLDFSPRQNLRELHRTFAKEEEEEDTSESMELWNLSVDDLFGGRTFQTVEECNAQALESILSLEEEALYAKSVLSEVKKMKLCLNLCSF
ncbi:hypothetical protein FisN_16Lh021 [Fistulifera solaris]|uniref:HSF-type DNA-binding domain-containing protein n=1 Tax=Fistulifera solaris TaxID=1519565 RepID=A0A1Z5KJ90_FISSO|nr:hypothetical protein FisN_16Lh021 [Fistulifera solaris]|eukprot:GAX26205.1 hypothetical protein FisN_16Lh021 [Fistulifera solaris]